MPVSTDLSNLPNSFVLVHPWISVGKSDGDDDDDDDNDFDFKVNVEVSVYGINWTAACRIWEKRGKTIKSLDDCWVNLPQTFESTSTVASKDAIRNDLQSVVTKCAKQGVKGPR